MPAALIALSLGWRRAMRARRDGAGASGRREQAARKRHTIIDTTGSRQEGWSPPSRVLRGKRAKCNDVAVDSCSSAAANRRVLSSSSSKLLNSLHGAAQPHAHRPRCQVSRGRWACAGPRLARTLSAERIAHASPCTRAGCCSCAQGSRARSARARARGHPHAGQRAPHRSISMSSCFSMLRASMSILCARAGCGPPRGRAPALGPTPRLAGADRAAAPPAWALHAAERERRRHSPSALPRPCFKRRPPDLAVSCW